jgi:hypothetical protein
VSERRSELPPDGLDDAALQTLVAAETAGRPPDDLLERTMTRVRAEPQLRRSRRLRRWSLPALGLAAALGLAGLAGLMGGLATPQVSPQPTSSSPSPTGGPSASPLGPQFEGSGIAFEYPSTWRLERATAASFGAGFIALLSRGLPACPTSPVPSSAAGGGQPCPLSLPLPAGAATLEVVVGAGFGGQGTSITIGERAFTLFEASPDPSAKQQLAWATRWPGRQRDSVLFLATTGSADAAAVRRDVESMLATLTFPASAEPSAAPPEVARYPGGVPETLGGEPVLVDLAAATHLRATTDATPFLIGGWFDDGTTVLCTGGIPPDPSPLFNRGCGSGPVPPSAALPPLYWHGQRLPDGRSIAVLRVHTHDPLAAGCKPENRALCDGVPVVDAILWTGDEGSATAPFTVQDAMTWVGSVDAKETRTVAPNTTAQLQRELFVTPRTCPSPWPNAVFELHGDPRFGLIAVYPSTAERESAQGSVTGDPSGCALDPRIVRPGSAGWIGQDNLLILAYGDGAAAAAKGALGVGPSAPLPVAIAGLDESYRAVYDYESARSAGMYDTEAPPELGYNDVGWTTLADRRAAADALAFVIGPGVPATRALVGPANWSQVSRYAMKGTATVYTVDHPSSTDPALRTEILTAYEDSAGMGWHVLQTAAP